MWTNSTADVRVTMATVVVCGGIIPVICILGIAGNILNLVVLANRKLQDSPYVYLRALAVSDLLTLLLKFFNSLSRAFFSHIYGWKVFEAQVYFPVAFASSTTSILLTLALTVERFIYVYYPIRAKSLCEPQIARIMVAVISLFSALWSIPRFFAYSPNPDKYFALTEFGHSLFFKIYVWVHIVAITFATCIAILIFNILLIRGVHKSNSRRRSMVFQNSSQIKRMRDADRLTITLIAVFSVFIISELPSAFVSRSMVAAIFGRMNLTQFSYQITMLTCSILVVLQHSTNFIFYCLFNKRFWLVFRQKVLPCTLNKVNTNTTTSSFAQTLSQQVQESGRHQFK